MTSGRVAPPGLGLEAGLWDLSHDLLAVAGLDGRLTRVSPSWTAVLGHRPEELTARPYIDFVHADDVSGTLAAAEGLSAPGRGTMTFEHRFRAADGTYRRLAWSCRASADAGAADCVVRDVTAAHDAAQERLDMLARLAVAEDRLRAVSERAPGERANEASRERSAFLATLSRALRTPLNGVIGMTDLLRTTALTPEQAGYAEDAALSAEALLTVVDDVRDASETGAAAPQHDLEPFDARATTERAAPAAPAAARVLVVEDDDVNQLLLERMLTRRGYEVELAGDGLDALDRVAAASDGFAAVFMDCQMPHLDGYAATAELRTREPEGKRVPIIAMTANALKGDHERCLAAGMDDYLAKPLRADRLDTVLERWISAPADTPAATAGALEPVTDVADTAGPPAGAPPAGARSRPLAATDGDDRIEDFARVRQVLRALSERRLVLFAQPIVELATDTVVQHELLIRMIGEDGERIAPDEFLPVAERYGLVSEVDRWVLREAVAHAAAGNAIHLNLSGGTLADPDIGPCVERELVASGAAPELLTFEITETALVASQALAAAFIDRVRSLGCHVALDDFGSGYGGFSYLKRLRVDCLKIDREFVGDLLTDPASERIVRAIVDLAAGFGLQTVGEGVEDARTLARLRSLGVTHAQGYHFARPAPAADVLSAGTTAPKVTS